MEFADLPTASRLPGLDGPARQVARGGPAGAKDFQLISTTLPSAGTSHAARTGGGKTTAQRAEERAFAP